MFLEKIQLKLMNTSIFFWRQGKNNEFLWSFLSYSTVNIFLEKSILQIEEVSRDNASELFASDYDKDLQREKRPIKTGKNAIDSHYPHQAMQHVVDV